MQHRHCRNDASASSDQSRDQPMELHPWQSLLQRLPTPLDDAEVQLSTRPDQKVRRCGPESGVHAVTGVGCLGPAQQTKQ